MKASSCAPVRPCPPNSFGQVIPAKPASYMRFCLGRSASICSLVNSCCPRSEPAAATASAVLRSQLAASHSRALARKSSTEIVSSVVVAVILFLSEAVDPADALAVPLGVTVEHSVGGEASQVEVQVVLPGEPDTAVHLETLLGELRARLTDVGLGDADDLRRGGPRVGDGFG